MYVEHLFLRSNAVDASPTNVHPWATSLQANSLLYGTTDVLVGSEKPFTVSFFANSLSGSVHPCTLFPDILPCMSGKDEFYTKLASD